MIGSLTRWRALAALFLLACVEGCDTAPRVERLVKEARLGVFFGGQVQQRAELARVLDGSQSQGFRLTFHEPLAVSRHVSWEIEMPAGSRGSSNQVQVTKLGEANLAAGQTRVDQAFNFEPGDPVGVWNVRVLIDDELVIDRAWLVYDPVARRRATADD